MITAANLLGCMHALVPLETARMAKVGRRRYSDPRVRLRPAQVEDPVTLDSFLTDLGENFGNNNPENFTVRIVAKSTDSVAARSVWRRLDKLNSSGIKVMAVFTKLGKRKKDKTALEKYADVFGVDTAVANIKVARFRNSAKLSEQVQMGEKGTWSEAEGNVEGGEIVGRADDNALAAAKIAFEMVWSIAEGIERKDVENASRRGFFSSWRLKKS